MEMGDVGRFFWSEEFFRIAQIMLIAGSVFRWHVLGISLSFLVLWSE